MSDVVGRLRAIAVLKTGDMIPEWLGGPGEWGLGLSTLAAEAADEIERLRQPIPKEVMDAACRVANRTVRELLEAYRKADELDRINPDLGIR